MIALEPFTKAVDSAARISALVERVQPRFKQKFLDVVNLIRDEVGTLAELERLVELGRIGDAFIFAESTALRGLGREWGDIFVLSGDETAKVITSKIIDVRVGFDRVNTRAVFAMQQNQLRLVSGFTAQQTAATRTAIVEGIRDGLNPREVARAFKGSIGLTSRQVSAVNNYKRLLGGSASDQREALTRALRDRRFDRSVLRSIRDDTPLGKAQIDKMVGRYHDRYITFRAETIARTEALGAVHAGSEAMFQQAVDDGDLNPNDLMQSWFTSGDERVRDFTDSGTSHRTMHGQKRLIGEPFVSGAGSMLMRPGDPSAPAREIINCRCSVTTRFTAA